MIETINFLTISPKNEVSLSLEAEEFLLSLPLNQKLGNSTKKALLL